MLCLVVQSVLHEALPALPDTPSSHTSHTRFRNVLVI